MFEMWYHFTKINKNLVDSFSDINIDFNHIFSCSHSSGCSFSRIKSGFIELLFFSVPQDLWKLWTLSLNILYKLFIFISNSKWGSWLCFLVYLLRCNSHVSSKVFFWDMSIFFLSFSLNIWIVTSEFVLWVLDEWCPWCTHPLEIKMQLGRIHPWFYESLLCYDFMNLITEEVLVR